MGDYIIHPERRIIEGHDHLTLKVYYKGTRILALKFIDGKPT